jgi:hypothetical protein
MTSPTLGYFNYGPEKLPHSVPTLGKGKFFQGNIIIFSPLINPSENNNNIICLT